MCSRGDVLNFVVASTISTITDWLRIAPGSPDWLGLVPGGPDWPQEVLAQCLLVFSMTMFRSTMIPEKAADIKGEAEGSTQAG